MKIGLVMLFTFALFSGPAAAEETIVSFNKASLAQIKTLFEEELGLPEELAEAIVKFREANGPFKTPDAMTNVPGMTQDFIEEINPQLMDGDVVFDPDAEPALAPSKC
jgi:competence protein ComEA